MTYVSELLEKAAEMTGSEELAKELLKAVPYSGNEEWTIKQMLTKYCSMVIEALNDRQAIAKQIAPGIYYVRDVQDENDVSVCIIDEDGKITFFNKDIEYENLHEYETYDE